MNYRIWILIIASIFLHFSCPAILISFEFQNGDIVFQDGSQTNFDAAVKNVTSSIDGYNFSHCGIYFVDCKGEAFVIEAIFEGVVNTPLNQFLNRHLTDSGKPKVVVGRLLDSLRPLIPLAIANAHNYLGKDYDFAFDLENDQIYCSELVYFAFKTADTKPLFEAQPMTFAAPNDSSAKSFWLEYFNKLNKEIPEGKLGINPGLISKSKIIKIVHHYY